MQSGTAQKSKKSPKASEPKWRYSPEVRRSMMLDTAADMVAPEGIAQLPLERIA